MGALFYAGWFLFIVNCKNILCIRQHIISFLEDKSNKTPGQKGMMSIFVLPGFTHAKRDGLPALLVLVVLLKDSFPPHDRAL